MPSPSLARQFFDKVSQPQNGYAFLADLPAISIHEQEWLEIKGASRLDDEKAKHLWSKTLSAFANVGGGVLIWGLDARKKDGVDSVQAVDLHPNARKFASHLREQTPNAINPPLIGIEIVPFTEPGAEEGFVVRYVPEGTVKPHRAEFCSRQYYLRVQDQSVVPEPPLLRMLFHPRSSAYLEPSILRGTGNSEDVTFHLCLKNKGAITARNVSAFLSIDLRAGYEILPTDQVIVPPEQKEHFPIIFHRGINPYMDANAFLGIRLWTPEFARQGFRLVMKLSWEDAPAAIWTRLVTYDDCFATRRLEWIYEGNVVGTGARTDSR